MYSVVLLMALGGGAEAPASHGCYGGYAGGGCYGGGYAMAGCYGGGYAGGGCDGGRRKLFGGGGLFGKRRDGGCHGGGYAGGCHGGYAGGGCYGGCYGGGYAGGCYGASAMAGCGPCGPAMMSGAGCYGGGMIIMPGGGAQPMPKDPKTGDGKTGDKTEVRTAAPATIIVTLPADAKLLIDDYVTSSTSETRTFATPALAPGQEFTYTLTAEAMRGGQKVTASKTIAVRAGETTRESLQFTSATVAEK